MRGAIVQATDDIEQPAPRLREHREGIHGDERGENQEKYSPHIAPPHKGHNHTDHRKPQEIRPVGKPEFAHMSGTHQEGFDKRFLAGKIFERGNGLDVFGLAKTGFQLGPEQQHRNATGGGEQSEVPKPGHGAGSPFIGAPVAPDTGTGLTWFPRRVLLLFQFWLRRFRFGVLIQLGSGSIRRGRVLHRNRVRRGPPLAHRMPQLAE